MLEAIPTGDRPNLFRAVRIFVGVDALQPGDRVRANVIAAALGLLDETAAADTNVHDFSRVDVLLDQFDPRFGQ
ncbi:hypothetical protein D3C80_1681300 [compost metagenome]